MPRRILIHHHVFKNAGSTVDRILKQNFGPEKSLAYDKEVKPGDKHLLTADELLAVLNDHPDCLAFSSHQLQLQEFDFDGMDLIDLALVRHPVDRLRSIHSFYNISPKLKTPFSIAAQETSIAEFMARLAEGEFPAPVESIQTTIFGSHFLGRWSPPTEATLKAAKSRIERLRVFGVVERFDECTVLLEDAMKRLTDSVDIEYEVVNQTSEPGSSLEDRLLDLRNEIGEDLYTRLAELNRLDIELWDFANAELTRRLEGTNRPVSRLD